MNQLPFYVNALFIACVLTTLGFLYKASRGNAVFVGACLLWCILQFALSMGGFYLKFDAVPPRFLLMVAPPMAVILISFFTTKGRRFFDSMDIAWLTLLHTIRIPVEIVIFYFFKFGLAPIEMTFEGRNFDILSGITAIIVYYLFFIRKNLSKKALIVWNILCLALLVNIVANAVLSAPTPFQQMAFEQPNIAIFMAPFNLLPAFIVPAVLLSHLVSLRHWIKNRTETIS
jgi:hypothetical protein